MTQTGAATITKNKGGRPSMNAVYDQRAQALLDRWAAERTQDAQTFRAWRANERRPEVRAQRRAATFLATARAETTRILGGTPEEERATGRQIARTARKEEELSVAARYVRAKAALRNATHCFALEMVALPPTVAAEVRNASGALESAFLAKRFTAAV